MVTRTIKQISSLTWVQVEKDTGDDNDTLLETCLEKVKTIGNCSWKSF